MIGAADDATFLREHVGVSIEMKFAKIDRDQNQSPAWSQRAERFEAKAAVADEIECDVDSLRQAWSCA